MSATAALPQASPVMAWNFPERIDNRGQALGLPADTLVYGLGRRWLTDGAGGFWPGGRGNKTFVREMLAAGPVLVESLPVIRAGEESLVLITHLLNAILARRGDLTGEDCEALYPVATAYSPGGREASLRHVIGTAHRRKLHDWLQTHLGELSVTPDAVSDLVS